MAGEGQLAALANQLREETDGTPEREAMLAELAADIREGRYVVDADALAAKLLEIPSLRTLCPEPENEA